MSGTATFYDVKLSTPAGTNMNYYSGNSFDFTVLNDYTLAVSQQIRVYNGTFHVHGDVYTNVSSHGSSAAGGDAVVEMMGTGDQHFYGHTTGFKGCLSKVSINKTSGTTFFHDYVVFGDSFELIQGTLSPSTGSTDRIIFWGSSNSYIDGSPTFHNVELYGNTYNASYVVGAGETMTVEGELRISGYTRANINTGTVDAKGDVLVTNTKTDLGTNTGTLKISGTGDQLLSGSVTYQAGRLPSVLIDKPSGTLTIDKYLYIRGNWTYNQGTVVHSNAATDRIVFNLTKTVSGNHTLSNVEFQGNGGHSTFTIPSGETLVVEGDMHVSGGSRASFQTGTIEVGGNLYFSNIQTGLHSQTATLKINGTGNQTLSGSVTYRGGQLPHIVVDKASGTLHLEKYLSNRMSWTHVQGDVTQATGSSDWLVFQFTVAVSGNPTFEQLDLYSSTSSNINITSGETMTVKNHLKIGGSYYMKINNGTLDLEGDLTNTNTHSSGGGTGLLRFTGTNDVTITGQATAGKGELPKVEMNKPDGIVTLASDFNINGNYTYRQGIIDPTASDYEHVHTSGSDIIDPIIHGIDPAWETKTNASVSESDITKSTSTNAWDAGVISGNELPSNLDGWVEYIVPDQSEDKAFGLAISPVGGVALADLDYGIRVNTSGDVKSVKAGVESTIDTYSSNDVLKMARIAGEVYFIVNGYIRDRQTTTPAAVWNAHSLIYTGSGTMNGLRSSFPSNWEEYPYASLRRKLDGGYFIARDGVLRFQYEEQYNDQDGELTYRIRNIYNNIVHDDLDESILTNYGDNVLVVDLTCSGAGLNSGYYFLEVENEKKEKWLLRFFQETNFVCNGTGLSFPSP